MTNTVDFAKYRDALLTDAEQKLIERDYYLLMAEKANHESDITGSLDFAVLALAYVQKAKSAISQASHLVKGARKANWALVRHRNLYKV